MAKKFQFDDEDNHVQKDTEEYVQPSRIDELENMKEELPQQTNDDIDEEVEEFDNEDVQPMAKKKKKKFVWKWWHYVLIGIGVLGIAFIIYIFTLSNNEGPVYGSRCEGIETINNDLKTATIDTMKKKYSDIKELTMEIACKQLKVDIVFKDGMDTKKAKQIAEETVQTLDTLVGKPKDDGKKYSTLFSKINNVSQYEVNLYLKSVNSKDFPIYGTKHIQNDSFTYTLASVKDKDSAKAAQDSLKK